MIIVAAALASVCCTAPLRQKEIQSSDLVLIYTGGAGEISWNKEEISDYAVYTDKDGQKHWLFDGFLFLRVWDAWGKDSTDVGYCWSFKYPSSAKSDWERLMEYYFTDGLAVSALDEAIADAVPELGCPPYKREVVMAIPYPSEYYISSKNEGGSTYWGELDGRQLDFSRVEDRFSACKWYIDYVLAKFDAAKYRYLELTGFYWIHEETTGTDEELIRMVSDYVHSKGYPLSWIPWFHAPGFEGWRDLGFDNCWEQPNYFFHDYNPYECLAQTCDDAKALGMGVELEFDEQVLEHPEWGEPRAGMLRDYMNVFKEEGAWEGLPVAYYQSWQALRELKLSGNPVDMELYHEVCDWIITRPYRNRDSGR